MLKTIRKKFNFFKNSIKKITSKTKVFDYNINHNQALDVMEYSKLQDVKTPKILINFDTHSDIYINMSGRNKMASIADWVNELLAKNPEIDTVYWVIPKEAALDVKYRFEFAEAKPANYRGVYPLCGNTNLKVPLYRFFFLPLTIKPFIQEFMLNPNDLYMIEVDRKSNAKEKFFSSKFVKVVTCCENNLPDFKNKDIFLSIDGDYFANSGYDTNHGLKFDKTKEGIEKSFKSILKTLLKKNIRPEIISLTLSPIYLPMEFQQMVLEFYQKFLEYSGKQKALNSYSRIHIPR